MKNEFLWDMGDALDSMRLLAEGAVVLFEEDARDRNVYFIPGERLMRLAQSEGLVDNCHPNDFGFYSMADAVIEVLENILRQNER